MDDAARSFGSEIVQVSAGYGDSRKHVLVANTDGVLATDEQVRTLLRISAVADGDTGMQTGYQSWATPSGSRCSTPSTWRSSPARRPGRRSRSCAPGPRRRERCRSSSSTAPAACCSTRRAVTASRPTSSRRARSVYAGKVGELVASPLVTLVDDGTMPGEWGAIGFDDEGHASQHNVLIQDGVLTDYMWDYLRARKDGRPQ